MSHLAVKETDLTTYKPPFIRTLPTPPQTGNWWGDLLVCRSIMFQANLQEVAMLRAALKQRTGVADAAEAEVARMIAQEREKLQQGAAEEESTT